MKRILFFVDGFAPTGEDMKQAAKLNAQVLFRNVQLFNESEPLEDCDGVAGLVPTLYAEKFQVKAVKPTRETPKEEPASE